MEKQYSPIYGPDKMQLDNSISHLIMSRLGQVISEVPPNSSILFFMTLAASSWED